jgi:hypothetical protein
MRYLVSTLVLFLGCGGGASHDTLADAAKIDAPGDDGGKEASVPSPDATADRSAPRKEGGLDAGPAHPDSAASDGGGPGAHLPPGMTVVIETGDMTVIPANGGQNGGATGLTWSTGGAMPAACTCDSPTTPSSVGEWSGNIQVGPGGHGIMMLYPSNLAGGYSPGRFHFALPKTGTGYLYAGFTFEYSSDWNFSKAIGAKLLEPRTVNAGNNHVFAWNCEDTAGNPDGVSAWPLFLLQGNHFADIPGAPAGYPGPTSVYSSTIANVGGPNRGKQHVVELYVEPETPTGTGTNGQITFWVDDVQVFTTVGGTPGGGTGIPSAGITFDSGGFNYIQFDPTYGGDSATDHPPAADQPMYWSINNLLFAVR